MISDYQIGQPDQRPWGEWEVLHVEDGFVVKRISVLPEQRLSLQKHRHRAEQWIFTKGSGRVTIDDQTFDVCAEHSVRIPRGAKHRIENLGFDDLVFVEIQIGAILSESDIERISDDYGRG